MKLSLSVLLLFASLAAFAPPLPEPCPVFVENLGIRKALALKIPKKGAKLPARLDEVLQAAGRRLEEMSIGAGMNVDEFDTAVREVLIRNYWRGRASDAAAFRGAAREFVAEVQENLEGFHPPGYFTVIQYVCDYWLHAVLPEARAINPFQTPEILAFRREAREATREWSAANHARRLTLVYRNLTNLRHARRIFEVSVRDFRGNKPQRRALLAWGIEIGRDYETVLGDLLSYGNALGRADTEAAAIESIRAFDVEVLGEPAHLEALVRDFTPE